MSPNNSKLSPNRKTTSCIKNKNGKRRKKAHSGTSINEKAVSDDFYCIRKKSIKHSEVDINNAVLSSPNGCIMTRNKLKKQLTSIDNSELVETTVIKDKCSEIDNIRSKSEKVFTNEISSLCPGKQLDTYYKKRTPLLFESDSDPEIDYFQIKDNIKNEEEEISTCISYPDDRFYPAFDKNVDIRTYFNKKLYPINNKSDVQSLNTFEKMNEEPSSLHYRVKTANDSNQCKRISQNYSKTSKSLKVTGPTTCLQINSDGDEIIIVTEALIRQLKNEIEIEEKKSQDIVKNSLKSISDKLNDTILVESYDIINNNLIIDLDSNNSTTISEEIIDLDSSNSTTISEEIIGLSNIQTFKCEYNSSDNQHNSEKTITSHLSWDQIDPNQCSHAVMKDEIKNKPIDLDSNNSTAISVEIIDSDSNNSTKILEEIIGLSNIQTFKCDNNSSDQNIDNQHNPEKNITSYPSRDQIEPNQYSHAVIKDEMKNKPIDLGSNNSTTISEEIIGLSNIQTFKCDNNSSDQSIENQHNYEKNITSHLSWDQIDPNQCSHAVIKDEIKNKPIDLDSNNSTAISVEIIDSDSNNSTTILEEIIGLSNIQTFKCDNNSSDQNIDNQHNPEKNITSYPSRDQIEPNQYSHAVIKDEMKNKPIDLGSNNSTTISEEIIGLSNIQTFKCDNNSSDQSIEIQHNYEKNITSHLSWDQIDPNQCSHAVIKDEIKNKPIDLDSNNSTAISVEIIDSDSNNSTTILEEIIGLSNIQTFKCDNNSSDSNNSTTISEEIIGLSNIQTFKCEYNSSDQSIDNQHNSDKNITYHLTLDHIEPNQYSHAVIKDEIKNKPIVLDSNNSTTMSVEIIDSDSNNSTTMSEEIIGLRNIQTFKCDNNSSDQSIENQHNYEKNITSHLSLDQIEPNQYSHTVIKDEIKNIPKYYNSKGTFNCLLKYDNLSSTNDSYSNKNDLNFNCYCKNFRSFNNDVNKIFTSKIKHFAFNNNAKKLREKILREKQLEANILNMLITKEHKDIIQSSKHNIPIFNSILIEKRFDLKENHHIKPEDTKTNAVSKINTNTKCTLKVADSSKDERTIDCLSSAASIKIVDFTTDVKCCENNLINPKNKLSSEINLIKVSNPILPKKNSFDDHMSFEMCNEFNKIKSLNKSISSNNTSKENNSVSLQNPNGESVLKSEINNPYLQKKTIKPSITTQTSNSIQKSRIPGIFDGEKETNTTLLFEPPQYKNLFDTSNTISSKAYQICPMFPHISENNKNEPVNNLFDLPVDDITFSLNNKSSDDDGNRRLFVSNSFLPKKNSLDDCMSFETCNEFYKIKSLNKSIVSKNESLPNHIQNILKEMYVDVLFVSTCQHMVDSYNDDDQLKNVFFQTDECRKIPSDVKLVCDIINKNGPMLSHISEYNEHVNNLFDLPVNDCFLINNNSSDDDDDKITDWLGCRNVRDEISRLQQDNKNKLSRINS